MVSSPLQMGFPTSVGEILARYGDALFSFIVSAVIFVVSFVIIYYVARAVLVRVTRRALGARDFSPAVISLGSSIAGAIALFGAFALAAAVVGFGALITAFATLTGALALAFGFAAKDLISNFVAGIFILKDEPFEVGDFITWSGNEGIVRDIQLRVTKLETFGNELVTVPNNELANNAVTNPMANDSVRVAYDFGIEYDADIEQAREIIVEEGAAIDGVLEDPAPSAPVVDLGDSAVVLQGRIWVNPRTTSMGGTKAQFVERVKHRFDDEGVGMPYPYTEVTGSLDVTGGTAVATED